MSTDRSLGSVEREAALRRQATREPADTLDHEQAPHPLIALGQQVGNAQVARMLAQREGEEDEEQVQAQHDLAQREGEEDEEQVQAQHDLAQREGEEDEEQVQAQHDLTQREGEEDEEQVQAKPEVGLEGGPVSDALSGRINAQRGGGAPLDEGTRGTMERGFGTSFANVRLHTGSQADALNRSISAKAFTTGNDIFFRKDTSPSDQGLLAHELTHVVQQRSMGGNGALTVGPAGDSHEQQADSVATAITSGSATQTAQREGEEEDEQQVQAQHDLAQREGEEEDEQQ